MPPVPRPTVLDVVELGPPAHKYDIRYHCDHFSGCGARQLVEVPRIEGGSASVSTTWTHRLGGVAESL